MRKMLCTLFLITGLAISGCSSDSSSGTTGSDPSTASTTTASEASQDITNDTEPVLTTAETTAKTLLLPVTANTTGKILIQTVSASTSCPYNSYMITSANGETVVVDPTEMPKIDVIDLNPSAIISTHSHFDHTDSIFTDSYDCPKIMYTKDDIQLQDFHIYTFYSSHDSDNVSEDTYNVIAVFEVGGLRIAHMGDIGQTELTKEQIEELGEIDVAFMQFENSYSNMSLSNEKGFNLIEQLNPKIVIPTHYSDAALDVLEEKYGPITVCDNMLALNQDDLSESTLQVYVITNTHDYR
jgi:L-ascorbate metabolism protein UlaG (beta-lactamase superfamily)